MRKFVTAIAVALTWPCSAYSQAVSQLVDDMIAADNAGLNDIDNYMIKTESMGMKTAEYFEKEASLQLDNGQRVYIMRNVPPAEIQERYSGGNAISDASPEELRVAADEIRRAGVMMEDGMREEIAKSGFPGGVGEMVMNPPPGQPWLSANPRDMTGMYATMLEVTADAKEAEARRDPAAEARRMQDTITAMKARSRVAGSEVVNGRQATILLADNLNQVQTTEDGSFTLQTAKIWVDQATNVPLRMRMEGVMQQGAQSRDITIEREDSDYRKVPGCGDFYEPFSSVMRMSGMLSDADRAELEASRGEMEEMQRQLEQMPPAQREMLMQQMGPQMKMLDNLANTGGVEIESRILELRCNTGLPDPVEMAQTTLPGAAGMPAGIGAGGAIPATTSSRTVTISDPEADAALASARQRCIEEKIAAQQAQKKQKRGFGKLLGAVSDAASKLGKFNVTETMADIYDANASAEDFAEAAKDLGLTEDDLAECENP